MHPETPNLQPPMAPQMPESVPQPRPELFGAAPVPQAPQTGGHSSQRTQIYRTLINVTNQLIGLQDTNPDEDKTLAAIRDVLVRLMLQGGQK